MTLSPTQNNQFTIHAAAIQSSHTARSIRSTEIHCPINQLGHNCYRVEWYVHQWWKSCHSKFIFFCFLHTCTHARWNTNPKTLTPPKNIYCRVVFFFSNFSWIIDEKIQKKNLKYNNNKKEFYLKKSIMWIASMQRVLMIATNCWRLLTISLLDYITIRLVLHHLSLVCLNCFCFF